MFIEGVDESHETPRRIVVVARHHRQSIEQRRVEMRGDGKIVGRAKGPAAEIVEVEPGDSLGGPRQRHLAALRRQPRRCRHRPIGQLGKGLPQASSRCFAQRRAVEGEIADALASIVDLAVQFEDVESLLEQRDEGQEAFALQTALVEVVGRAVRCRDNHDALLEQGPEEPAEEHGIGNVGHLEFVEAQ